MWITNVFGGRTRGVGRLVAVGLAVALAGCQDKPGSGSGSGGSGPTLTLSRPTVDFGKVLVGETSSKPVKWSYSAGVGGPPTIEVTGPFPGTNAPQFTITPFPAGAKVRAGEATPEVKVTFTPDKAGAFTETARPQVTGAAMGAVVDVTLKGEGVYVAVSGEMDVLREGTPLDDARKLDFGGVPVTTTKPLTLTIQNKVGKKIVFKTPTWKQGNQGFGAKTPDGLTLHPAATLRIKIEFTPAALKDYEDVLTLADADGKNSVRVTVMGKGIANEGH
jgi:hypothetical protein